MKQMYFAHPISIYNTPKEKALEMFIEHWLDGSGFGFLVNPNRPIHQLGYKEEGMDYFIKIVDLCDSLIIYPFEDNTIGAGIMKEAQRALDSKKSVYQINPKNWGIRKIEQLENCLTVEETREKLKQLKDE